MSEQQPSEVYCAGDDHWFYGDAPACACGASTGPRREREAAGWHPSGLRLGERQEQVLRRWPMARIRPKSVALGLRSLFAEVDALRAENEQLRAALTGGEGR